MSEPGHVAWANLRDSSGRKVSEYQLFFKDPALMDVMGKFSVAAVDFIWQLFIFVSAVAAKLLGWVADPSFLKKMEEIYSSLTSELFSVVNPLIIGTLGLAVTVFYLFIDDKRIDGNDFQRIGAAIILLLGIALITLNPFKIIRGLMTSVQTLVTVIGGENTAAGGSAVVDFLIRQPTLIINYNGKLPASCFEQWSSSNSKMESCASGGLNSGSLEAMSEATTSTIFLALIAASMGIAALAFAAQAIWKFAKHLTLGILGFLALGWVAAVSMTRRRQFDSVGTMTALALGHLAMALIVQVISIGGPTLVMTLMSGWSQQAAVLKMMILAVSYIVLFVILSRVTKETGPLVKALKAGGADDIYKNLGLVTEGAELPTQASGGSMGSAASAFRAQADQRAVELLQNRRGLSSGESAVDGSVPEADVDAASKPAVDAAQPSGPVVSIVIGHPPQQASEIGVGRSEATQQVVDPNHEQLELPFEDAYGPEQPELPLEGLPDTEPSNDTPKPAAANPFEQDPLDSDQLENDLAEKIEQQGRATGIIGGRSPNTQVEGLVAHEEAKKLNRRQRLRETRQQVQESRIAGKPDEELTASDALLGTKLRAYTSVARDSLISPEKRNRVSASYPVYTTKKGLAAGRRALWGSPATPGDVTSSQVPGNVRLPLQDVEVANATQRETAIGNQPQVVGAYGGLVQILFNPDGISSSNAGFGDPHAAGVVTKQPGGNASVNTEDNSKNLAPENAATP